MPDRVYFETGSAEIAPADSSWFFRAARWIKQFPHAEIDIVGYADERGNPAANKRLALKRAQAVYAGLLAHGAPAEQLVKVTANGSGQPLVEGHTEEAWAKNRAAVAYVRQRGAALFGTDPSCKLRVAPKWTSNLTRKIDDLPPDVYIDFLGRLSARTPPGIPAITNDWTRFDRTGKGMASSSRFPTATAPRKFHGAVSSGDRLVIWYDHGGPRLHFHAVAYALTEQRPRLVANVLAISRDICTTTDALLKGNIKSLKRATEW